MDKGKFIKQLYEILCDGMTGFGTIVYIFLTVYTKSILMMGILLLYISAWIYKTYNSCKLEERDDEAVEDELTEKSDEVGEIPTIELTEKDKIITAYHEAGHIVMAKLSETLNKVDEAYIIPNGDIGGCTKITVESRNYVTKKELIERVRMSLAGRVAEQIVFGDVSNGVSEDLKLATEIVIDMVTIYGMDEEVGLISFNGLNYIEIQLMGTDILNKIGFRIQAILKEEEEQVTKIINDNRELLERIAKELIQKEAISEKEINEIINEVV